MAKIDYKIPFNKPYVSKNVLKHINFLIESKQSLEGGGLFSQKCQNLLKEKYGINKVLLTTSCTSSLEMGIILANIQDGDEVIMPSYTFVSTANAVILRGGIPVFVDINLSDFNIDINLIKKAITKKTKAIIPVHYGGNPCEMDKIIEIAKENNLFVIEDAAQAINSYYKNNALGTFGDIGAVSFHSTKNVQAGECGAIFINNNSLYDRADYIIEKGTNRKKYFNGEIDKYSWIDIGSSYYPNELTSAYLYAQLEDIDYITKERKFIWDKYNNFLKKYDDKGYLKLPHILENSKINAHNYFVLMNSNSERNNFMKYLKDNSIQVQTHFVPLHSSPYGKLHSKISGTMDNTDLVYECSLRLPLYIMDNQEINYVLNTIKKYFE